MLRPDLQRLPPEQDGQCLHRDVLGLSVPRGARGMSEPIRILNLGAGWQSSTLYLLSTDRDPRVPRYDYAIMADPGEEAEGTYRHVEWLKTQGGPPILVRKLGARLGDDLILGRNTRGRQLKPGGYGRFTSIP